MANQDNEKDTDNSNRGFAGMEAEKQREIASQGGRAAHARALLHKDLKCKAPLIEPNLRRNLGKWST
ncbi:KGG domain-containing protein [Acinetobacter variabilis]|uniref:KGG domain-containing protein n=1 Tax=Acinetobacter variabilis TaxID=70346 RepID=UPI00403D908A